MTEKLLTAIRTEIKEISIIKVIQLGNFTKEAIEYQKASLSRKK